MAVTLTFLKQLDADATAITVDSAGAYVYIGTNKGDVWQYNVGSGVVTLLKNIFNLSILAIECYSTTILYVTAKDGAVYSLTTS